MIGVATGLMGGGAMGASGSIGAEGRDSTAIPGSSGAGGISGETGFSPATVVAGGDGDVLGADDHDEIATTAPTA